MYGYNEDGVRVDLTEIWESVTVVPHPKHSFKNGYCGCGYRCDHADGFDENEMCQNCGAYAVASIGNEMFTDLAVAFARANELSAANGENVTVKIINSLSDVACSGYAVGKITLDLNGYNIGQCEFYAGKKDKNGKVIAEGDLTITNSVVELNSTVNQAALIGGKLTVNGGSLMSVKVYGGEASITGGTVSQFTAENGETHISGGLTKELCIKGGKTYVTGGSVTDFKMNDGGEIYISDGNFNRVSVDISNSDDENSKLEITGGTFENAGFAAKTKGRITISGGEFKSITVAATAESSLRTVGDLLGDGYMYHSSDDGSFVSGNTDVLSESVKIIRHIHSYIEKTDTDGKNYGECACGEKAEAVIEKSDSRTYFDTFEKAAEATAEGDTIRLCANVECEDDITFSKGVYRSPVTLSLDGKSLHFAEGKKLIVSGYSYFDVIDNDSENGSISYLRVDSGTVKLYGGTYGKIESNYEVDNLKPIGCGFRKADGSGWITKFNGVKELTDVTVKRAPFTANVIVTNDPDGTTTPDVIYLGQNVYFKVTFSVDGNEPQIGVSNPMACTISYNMPDGSIRGIAPKYSVYGGSTVKSAVLPDTDPAGKYSVRLRLDYLGCTIVLDELCPFNVAVCPHNSFTDDICNICGLPCKHTDVSEDGHCGTCGMDFILSLATVQGSVSYFTNVAEALATASLKENRGCILKLFKNVEEYKRFYLTGTAETRAELTIDLNGHIFGNVNAELTLSYTDLTIKTSVSGGLYTSFMMEINISNDATVTCPSVGVNTLLQIYRLKFATHKGTSKVSFGSGVYLDYFNNPTDATMKFGDILSEGCVFGSVRNDNIYPRSENIPFTVGLKVIDCPHSEWNGNECRYCGLVCDHPDGYTDGICRICGRACEHKNLDENFFCNDCKQQMTAELKTADGTVTYGTNFAERMNTADNGATVTLLADTSLGEDVYVYGKDKTITLDLNGHSVGSDSKGFFAGRTSSANRPQYGTLKIVGKGKILNGLTITESGTVDLSGWTGGEIKQITVYQNSAVTGSIPNDAYIETLCLTAYTTQTIDVKEIKLGGGRFGKISWQNYNKVDLPLGTLLAPGYAFQREDKTFVPYEERIAPYSSIDNVKVVKCENHVFSDSNGKCIYCNTQFAASIVDGDGNVYKYYTDLELADAVKKQLELGDEYKIQLLGDFGIWQLSEGSPKIDLNGHTVETFWITDSCRATILGEGAVQHISVDGNQAGLAASTPTVGQIVISTGATWSSILPSDDSNGYPCGYKVYDDTGAYKWYNRNTMQDYAEDRTDVKNKVSIQPLPIKGEPILMLGDEILEDQCIVSNKAKLIFSVKMPYTSDAKCYVYRESNDGSIWNEKFELYNDGSYCSVYSGMNLGRTGTYKYWAVVSKDGYECKTEVFNIISKQDLADEKIKINLKQYDFTYTPQSDGDAKEFKAEIESVTLPDGGTLPADAYEVSGDTGKEAKDYTITITAKENSDYVGSGTTTWKINPLTLTDIVPCDHIKNYDGTTDITADDIGKMPLLHRISIMKAVRMRGLHLSTTRIIKFQTCREFSPMQTATRMAM